MRVEFRVFALNWLNCCKLKADLIWCSKFEVTIEQAVIDSMICSTISDNIKYLFLNPRTPTTHT